MNNGNRRGNRRIGAKPQSGNRTNKILAVTGVIWVVYLIDEFTVAHNPIWFVILLTVGIWAVGIVIAKPGKFSRKVYEVGFWNALFNRVPKNRRRRGNKGYRR